MYKFNHILFIFIVLAVMFSSACSERMVCSAYQSAFILDNQKQHNYFAPMKNDTTPRVYYAHTKTNKNGIGKTTGYRKKQTEMRMVSMNHVYRDLYTKEAVDSSMLAEVEVGGFREVTPRDTLNTVSLDSLAGAEIPAYMLEEEDEEDEWSNTARFNYNVDMVKYMEQVGNDVMLFQYERREMRKANEQEKAERKAERGFMAFFRNLFKKKEVAPVQEETKEAVEEEEEDEPIGFDVFDEDDDLPPVEDDEDGDF